jgi:uncharacterized membrane protein YoaK (UPF0700 family)
MFSDKSVVYGCCLLAFGAAFTNTCLVIETGTSVSHLTGDMTKLAINVANWSPVIQSEFYKVLMAAWSFLLGAFLAGFWINKPSLDIQRPYGRCLIVIGLFILMASLLLKSSPSVAIAFVALGCGFQNGLSNNYKGIILRTTHLTGLFTDLGVALGMKVRGHGIELIKILIPFLLSLFFVIGSVVSTVMYLSKFDVLFISGITYIVIGVSWSFIKHKILKLGSTLKL